MKRRGKTSAVVFDLDGTLIDSLPLVLRAIAHAIEPFGPSPTNDIFAHLGGPPERFLPGLMGDPRHVSAAVARMKAFHHEHSHLIQSFDGVHDFLQRLQVSGVNTAIWTGRDRASTDSVLREQRLADFFPVVLCGDDLPTHKPDPQGLAEILKRLDTPVHETLFLGDADVDVLGGVAIGVDTVLIEHTRAIAGEVRAKAWRTVATPRQAYELVLEVVAQG